MSKRIIAGIDIGTHSVRAIVAVQEPGSEFPRILGAGSAESKGLRHGYIVNSEDTIKSVQTAIAGAEKAL